MSTSTIVQSAGCAVVARQRSQEAAMVSRVSSDYMLRALESLAGLFDGDFLLVITYMALTKATVADRKAAKGALDVSDTGVLPDSLRRPTTALAVANSLGMPRETVRRYVNRLIAMGYCERLPDRRLIVTNAVLNRSDFRDAAHRNYRDVARLIADLRRVLPTLPEV